MKLLISWIVRSLIVLVAAYLVPGFKIESFITALTLVAILGILNLFVGTILKILTLPINLLTLGLFTFIINAFLLELAATFVQGVHIDSFLTAIISAVFIGFLSTVAGIIL